MPRKERAKRAKAIALEASARKCRKLDVCLFGLPEPTQSTPSTNGASVLPESTQSTPSTNRASVLPESTQSTPSTNGASVLPESSGSGSIPKYRPCKVATLKSWGHDWIGWEVGQNDYAVKVWCRLCKQYYGAVTNTSGSTPRHHALSVPQLQCNYEAYITGTSNVKKDTADSHAKSKSHIDAVTAMTPVRNSRLSQQFAKMNDDTKQRMAKLFDLAYTVAKCEQPFSFYKTMVSVEKKHGVELGMTYANTMACREFIGHIAGVMLDDLTDRFPSSSSPEAELEPFYFSFLFDGSSDKAMSEKEVVSIKLIEDGLPRIRLLGISEPARGDASGIFDSLMKLTEERQLDAKKSLVATAADGASVNFGQVNGVLTKLQQHCAPWMLKVHCVAHKLELSLKDAFKDTYFEKEIDELMMNLYYMFRRSPKKWRAMLELSKVFETSVLKPVRSQGTRWINHRLKAVDCLLRNYSTLVRLFEEMGSGHRKDIPETEINKIIGRNGYLSKMKSAKFVTHLVFYKDLIGDLSDLSMSFQRDNLPPSAVRDAVECAYAALRRKLVTPSLPLRKVTDSITEAVEAGASTFKYDGIEIGLGPYSDGLNTFQRQAEDMVNSLLSCVGKRFNSFMEDPVIKAASILDIGNYPTDLDDLLDFGNDDLEVLINHFQPMLEQKGCYINEMYREWTKLKVDVSKHLRKQTFQQAWKKILCEKKHHYSNINHIIRILLVCPVSTAQVERQFSTIKRMLGDWRLKLKTETIERLLRIVTEGPEPLEYCSDSAVARWWSSGERSKRPNIHPYGSRSSSDKTAGVGSDSDEVAHHFSDTESDSEV